MNKNASKNIHSGSLALVVQETFLRLAPHSWAHRFTLAPAGGIWDALLEFPEDGSALGLVFRQNPRPEQFPFGVPSDHGDTTPVLGAPHLSDRLKQFLQERGWSWVDGAGNAHVSIPAPARFYVERSGRPPLAHPPRAVRLNSPQALQVIRCLLHPAHAGRDWQLRTLMRECAPPEGAGRRSAPPSLGFLSRFIRGLKADGYLHAESPRSPMRLRDAAGLLSAAAQTYPAPRRINLFTLLPKAELQQRLDTLGTRVAEGAAYAAFGAADRLAPMVQQNKTWVMVAGRFLEDMLATAQAKVVDSGENLVVLVPEGDDPFYRCEGDHGHMRTTGAVQTYWDLIHAGGRGEEAAQAILKQCLLPVWRREGAAK